jgi:NitT/TauT family transport system substrate-binding protein
MPPKPSGWVDAAVIWKPHLTVAKNAEHGHLLTDSSKQPGLIVDCLLTTSDTFAARKAEFQALGRSWASAVDYVAARPDEAIEIMARSVGGWPEDPAEFGETLKGIRYYDGARNREHFGTAENLGQVYDTVQKAIDVWSSLGLLKVDLTPADVIRHGVWAE